MPALIQAMMGALDEGQQKRANDFWENAYAYAMQSVPYAQDRLDQLNQSGIEIVQALQGLPEPEQKKLFEKLSDDLIKPIEGNTAKEFDAAWQRLQKITTSLHKTLVPTMPGMMQQGMGNGLPPQPPTPPSPLGQLDPNAGVR